MDFKSIPQPKSGNLSSLRAGKILRPSPLVNESNLGEQKTDGKRSTPDNIRRLRSQKVYSSPSDNIMTPITRKLTKKNGLIHDLMVKMDFNDNAEPDNKISSEVFENELPISCNAKSDEDYPENDADKTF